MCDSIRGFSTVIIHGTSFNNLTKRSQQSGNAGVTVLSAVECLVEAKRLFGALKATLEAILLDIVTGCDDLYRNLSTE